MTGDASSTEYATTPVPLQAAVSGWQVAFVITGIAITLPGLYSGGEIAQTLGLGRALLALVFASAVLALMSIPTAIIGQRTRRTSYHLIRHTFGPAGGMIINVIFAIVLLGWYAVTADLFGRTLGIGLTELFGLTLPTAVLTIASSAMVIVTTIFGFKAIDRLAIVVVPLLFLLILYVSVTMLGGELSAVTPALEGRGGFSWAVNAVVGAMIVNVVLLPDLTRYARTRGDAILAAVMGNGIGTVVASALAMVPALVTGQLDPMAYMLAAGLGFAALFVLVGATWTTNAVNLYSTGLVIAEVSQRERYGLIVAVCGVLGTGLALTGLGDHLIDLLIFLGVLVPPVAGVYLIDYYLFGSAGRYPASASASAGLAASLGALVTLDVLPASLTSGIIALDTLLLSALLYWLMTRAARRRLAA